MIVWKCGNKMGITDDAVAMMWSGLNKEEECEFLYEFDVLSVERKGDEVIIRGKVRKEAKGDE